MARRTRRRPACPRRRPGTAGSTPTAIPHGTGLVAILHPWESGRDNSIDWDAALARVPTDGVDAYVQRRDTQHVDAAQRPHKAEYDRYLWLVQRFRELGWDNTKLHDASPFRVVDPGFNAILIRSDSAISPIWRRSLGRDRSRDARPATRVETARAAPSRRLWSEKHGQFCCLDRASGELVDSASSRRPAAGLRRARNGRSSNA